jgi:hypothetical protein
LTALRAARPVSAIIDATTGAPIDVVDADPWIVGVTAPP